MYFFAKVGLRLCVSLFNVFLDTLDPLKIAFRFK